ncbi:hypothetical protein FK535_16670 [Mycolicibacterium sp. 018/SC-01/001]|uniref:hypothetical protein n=1 Tax=Mycolicibacterium sp. 018/SC-01/001 TaxID=2592069 RepID=UPI0011813700|nr:hypothetical protein [Mycolicibacterium sp. 018/SC-01/001]TRW81516.1 hypothetical protein FK535_16670 [Mycolicibacterium sp. 018/SC-01/001]
MTRPDFAFADLDADRLDSSPRYWDPATECTVIYARPSTEPELWSDFVAGATHSYQQHGIGAAIDSHALLRGDDTALFAACVNEAGRVVGGLRAKGPYRSVDECHATEEWAGQAGEDAVRKMVADRLPFGVAEMKTAWVADDPELSRRLTTSIARTPLHAMDLLGIQFVVATAASYVLKRWLTSGGVLAAKIPPTPYPDVRYQTRIAWWDRLTFANHAQPRQFAAFLAEQRAMTGSDFAADPAAAASRRMG